jgi:hypothetical protein
MTARFNARPLNGENFGETFKNQLASKRNAPSASERAHQSHWIYAEITHLCGPVSIRFRGECLLCAACCIFPAVHTLNLYRVQLPVRGIECPLGCVGAPN